MAKGESASADESNRLLEEQQRQSNLDRQEKKEAVQRERLDLIRSQTQQGGYGKQTNSNPGLIGDFQPSVSSAPAKLIEPAKSNPSDAAVKSKIGGII